MTSTGPRSDRVATATCLVMMSDSRTIAAATVSVATARREPAVGRASSRPRGTGADPPGGAEGFVGIADATGPAPGATPPGAAAA